MKILVAGSSFAAYGCILALLKHNQPAEITVIDGGRDMEPDTNAAVQKLRGKPYIDWAASNIRPLTGSRYDAAGFPLKTEFGSDYCYTTEQDTHHQLALQDPTTDLLQSAAVGGFSNLWGGSMLPMHPQEYARWPFGEERLEPHYRSILSRVPLAGTYDSLAEHYPLYTDQPQNLLRNPADTALLAEIHPATMHLRQQGIFFGQSRLAIYADGSERACTYCNHCLHGCPRNAVFSTRSAFSDWAAAGKIVHEQGNLLHSFRETEDGVEVILESSYNGQRQVRSYDRIFAGPGALQSARIYLRSYPDRVQSLQLHTARKFLIPFWSAIPDPNMWSPRRLSTPGVFCSIQNTEISPHALHLQLSGANAMILQRLGLFPGPARFRRKLFHPLLSRLRVFWAGAHAEHSPTFTLRMHNQAFEVAIAHEPDFHTLQQALLQLLRYNRKATRLTPIGPLVKTAPPGGGVHNGACMPMAEHPISPDQTDFLGRPAGLSRVHFVDASVFATVPSTTMALTIMANAHRIATETLRAHRV